MKHWLRWSARHKWVSRSLARDEWIARTSDDQIVSNVTACKLALTTRAHGFLTANDGPNFAGGIALLWSPWSLSPQDPGGLADFLSRSPGPPDAEGSNIS